MSWTSAMANAVYQSRRTNQRYRVYGARFRGIRGQAVWLYFFDKALDNG